MKTILLTCLTCISLTAFGEYYSKLKQLHGFKGCIYYDVEVWNDGSTPNDLSDDVKIASSTLTDCINALSCDSKTMTTTEITEIIYAGKDGNCPAFRVNILNAAKKLMISDMVFNPSCL